MSDKTTSTEKAIYMMFYFIIRYIAPETILVMRDGRLMIEGGLAREGTVDYLPEDFAQAIRDAIKKDCAAGSFTRYRYDERDGEVLFEMTRIKGQR